MDEHFCDGEKTRKIVIINHMNSHYSIFMKPLSCIYES